MRSTAPWTFVAVLLAISVGRAGAAEPAPAGKIFRAGAAAVDITPTQFPVIVNCMFEERTADRANDQLHARALVLDDGEARIALVIVDSCMMPRELLDEAKELAQKATGIPTDRMLISATHTHSAPSVGGCLGSDPDPEYSKVLPGQLAKAIKLAADRLAPARVGWAVVNDPEHTFCRNWIFRSDRVGVDPFGLATVRANMHPGHQNQSCIGPSGPVDAGLSVLSLQALDGRPIAVLANYSMHYFNSTPLSADYFGLFAEKLAGLIGQNADPAPVAILSQGTSGDLQWMDYSQPAKHLNIDAFSAEVAQQAFAAYRKIEYRDWAPLVMREKKITLGRRLPDEQRLAWAKNIVAGLGPRKPRSQPEIYAREQLLISAEPRRELKLQAVRIGDLGITAIPNEVFSITGLKIKAQSPLEPTFNIELANGTEGYIPPPELYKFGGYNTWAARSAGLEEQAEPKVVETVLALLEEVAGKPRRKPADPPTPYSQAVLASKPLAYWRLSEMAGQTALDAAHQSSAEKNQPAEYEDLIARFLEGPQSAGLAAAGEVNRAAHFAGGRLKTDKLALGDAYSVELWFWNGLPNAAHPITAYLFSRAADGTVAGDHLGIGGTSIALGKLLLFNGNEKDGKGLLSGTTTIQPKTWNHVVFTRSGNKAVVYLNGNKTPEIGGELNVAPGRSGQLFFGGRSDKFAPLEGKLDEVAVYDRELKAEEASEHFAASKFTPPVAEAGLRPNPPRSPADSLKVLHVRPGFEVQLVAAEPLVIDPVAIAWGADGKLWVVEMADYPLGLDGKMKSGGRVRWLADTDGDGKYDQSTLFLESVNFPTGIMPWRDGVIVTAAPAIFYAADTDGDGKADQRKTLYRGFIEGNPQLRVNGLQWGLDGWLYCANGWSGGVVTSLQTGANLDIRGRDLRIQPDLGLMDPQSGVSEFGRNRNDWGDWFGCDNSNPLFHFVLADHYTRRNPHAASPDPKRQLMAPPNPKVFALSPLQKRYHSFEQSGRFTSACATMIYRDELLFGRTPADHAFVCEPVHNLVHHEIVEPQGVSFTARRSDEEQQSEFLASEDAWFRPVMTCTGPDGALWVVDMYRFMIEHPEWLPPEGKAELGPYFRLGEDKGRIYRIVPQGKKARAMAKLAGGTVQQLVEALDSPNGWQRDAAQQQLMWKKDAAAVAPLEGVAKSSGNPLARLQALATLAGLESLKSDVLIKALADGHPGVRREAVRLAEAMGDDAALVAAAVKLTPDLDAKVRQQLAYTLGAWPGDEAARGLAELAAAEGNDPAINAAILSSVTKDNITRVLSGMLVARKEGQPPGALFDPLLGLAAAYGKNDMVLDTLTTLLPGEGQAAARWQVQAVAGLLGALERRAVSIDQLTAGRGAGAGALSARLDSLVELAQKSALDAKADPTDRIAGLQLFGRRPARLPRDLEALAGLLSPKTPVEVQTAAVARLSGLNHPQAAALLLAGWAGYGPALRGQVLGALMSRKEWTAALLDSLEQRRIAPADFDAASRQRLTTNQDPAIKARAQRLLVQSGDANRRQVLEKFAAAATLPGQKQHGLELFQKKCGQCHRHGDAGHEVGPNLASLTDKSPQSLLVAILDPSRAVETRYLNYIAQTDDGRSLSGVLASETGNSITLLGPEGKQQTVLRGEIEQLKSTGKSLMPDGLEQDLTAQDLADLLAYIGATPGPAKASDINKPSLIKPAADGSLRLLASNCEIKGSTVVLEENYGNLGYWHTPDDRAEWTIEIAAAARYQITLDFALGESPPNEYVIECGAARFQGKTHPSGSWDHYIQEKVGEITLPAGKQKLIFRPTPALRGALIDLNGIMLTPVK